MDNRVTLTLPDLDERSVYIGFEWHYGLARGSIVFDEGYAYMALTRYCCLGRNVRSSVACPRNACGSSFLPEHKLHGRDGTFRGEDQLRLWYEAVMPALSGADPLTIYLEADQFQADLNMLEDLLDMQWRMLDDGINRNEGGGVLRHLERLMGEYHRSLSVGA